MHLSELTSLLTAIPDLTKAAEAEAKEDKLTTKPEQALVKIAPKLAAISAAVPAKQTEKAVRDKAKKLVAEVEDVLVDIDESIARIAAAVALPDSSVIFAGTATDHVS